MLNVEYIEDNKFDIYFDYNTDKTGLNWKVLPSKSLMSQRETAVPEYNVNQRPRIIVMVCANVTPLSCYS